MHDYVTKPILCLDFDGVCHSYISGWKGASVADDPPVAGIWEFLKEANAHFHIQVYSSRSRYEDGIAAMINWFDKYAPYTSSCTKSESHITWYDVGVSLSFPITKPAAMITIDDRAITFTGQWPDVSELLKFKPWNK